MLYIYMCVCVWGEFSKVKGEISDMERKILLHLSSYWG